MDFSTGEANSLNWFEIPATDFPRAKAFYEKVFDFKMEEMQMGPFLMGFFPYAPGTGKASGAIVKGEGHTPSKEGALIYLNGNPDLNEALSRVEASGGKVLMEKTEIAPDIGFQAIFLDTEGNRLAMHSQA